MPNYAIDDLLLTQPQSVFVDGLLADNYYRNLPTEIKRRVLNFCDRVVRVTDIDENFVYVSGMPTGVGLKENLIIGLWDGETVPRNNSPIIINSNLRCERCGDRFNEEGYNTDDQNGAILCPSCRKRKSVLPYHRFAPKLEFYCSENENPDDSLYMGVELEVDEGGESDRTVSEILPIMNENENKFFIYCSHDGSLENGFEIITQPATLEYHTSIESKYKKLFEKLVSKGYQSHNTSTCGIHVHFNRSYYADNENLYITRLLYLMEKFWDEIVIFSRRMPKRMDRYSKKIDCSTRSYINQYNKSNNHDGHYYALNITNENTIEFRVFRGTLNLESFMAILEFVNNIVRISKEYSTRKLQGITFEDILTDRAKAYYNSRIEARTYEE